MQKIRRINHSSQNRISSGIFRRSFDMAMNASENYLLVLHKWTEYFLMNLANYFPGRKTQHNVLNTPCSTRRSCGSAVGIATGYGFVDRRVAVLRIVQAGASFHSGSYWGRNAGWSPGAGRQFIEEKGSNLTRLRKRRSIHPLLPP